MSNPPVSENPATVPSPSHSHERVAFRQESSVAQQTLLLEIAKSRAGDDPAEFCCLFDADASGLTEKSRAELAKWISEISPGDIAENIHKFAISNEEKRIEIAKYIAEKNSYPLVKNFQNFNIYNEDAKIELAHDLAEKEAFPFIRNVHKFKITNEKDRIELFLKIAEGNLKNLIDNFQNFEISSESGIIELVNKIAEKYLKDLIEKIQYLESHDGILARVAHQASERKLHSFVSHIQVFKISNENAKIELAQRIAEICPKVLAENIHKFEIADEGARIELAKIVAEKDLEVLVNNFRNFAINDESAKLELAQLLIRKHLSTALIDDGYLDKLQISDPSVRANLYASAYLGLIAKGDMRATNETLITQFFPHDSKPMPLAQVAAQFGNRYTVIADLLKAAEKQPDPHIRGILSTWAQLVSLRFAADQLPEAAWQNLKAPLEAIQKWRSPTMRYVLTHLLAQQCLPPEAKDVNGFFAFCKQFTRTHIHLYPALLFPLFQSAPDDSTLPKLVKLLRRSEDFKDAKRQKALVNALVALVQADRLSDNLKRSLLQAALGNDSDHEAARSLAKTAPLMECLVSFAQHSPGRENAVLQRLKSIRKPDDFNDQMNKAFKDLFPNLSNAQNAADQFNHYREHARHATGLITYTVKMQNYWNPREKALVLAAIEQFVNATVLSTDPEHTFRQLRYDPTKSSHLRVLAEKAPEAFAQWKQSCISPLSSKQFPVVDTDSAEDLFLCGTEVAESCQSIQNEPYYNKTLMGYVLDGKYRMLAIKSEDGRLMGRRMLRLLWDEQARQPVLHLEHFYKNPGIPKKYEQALVELALEKAKQMKCALVSHDTELELGDLSPAQLTAYPTPWPFESVDGEMPTVLSGKEGYKLPLARIVVSPH